MNCLNCQGEMNPVNIEGSVLECVKCNGRRHVYLPDLDVTQVRIDLGEVALAELPFNSLKVFKDSFGDESNDA